MTKMRNLITSLHGRFNCLTGNIQVAFTLKRIFWMFFSFTLLILNLKPWMNSVNSNFDIAL